MDDFANYLRSQSEKVEDFLRLTKGTMSKTVIVRPKVWSTREDAERASRDWSFREQTELLDRIAGSNNGVENQ